MINIIEHLGTMHAKSTKKRANVTTPTGWESSPEVREPSALGSAFRYQILFHPDFPARGDIGMRYRNFRGGTDLPGPHFHDALEIGVIHKGRGAFLVGSRLTAFSSGDIFIIDGSVPHVAFYATLCVCSWLYFDLKRIFGLLQPKLGILQSGVLSARTFENSFSSRKYPQLAQLVDAIIGEFSRKEAGWEESVRGYLLVLLAQLDRLRVAKDWHFGAGGDFPPAQQKSLDNLAMAIDFMHTHYSEKIGMEEIARAACMSTTGFRQQFRRHFGMPPHEYLTLHRLRIASEKLKTTGDKIDAIANECGFEDSSSFRRAFRKAVGVSPGHLRRQANDGAQG